MAKKVSNNFTEAFFIQKGFLPDGKGGWTRPPIASEYIREKKGELIAKEKVIETPDFTIKPVTEWFIPGQTPSKKNSRQSFVSKSTGRIINIPSKGYKAYIDATKDYWVAFSKEFNRTVQVLDLKYPLDIEMTFTRKTNQIVDFFGPGESIFDLMSDFNFWSDDSIRFGKPFFGDMKVDKNNPGCLIKILLPNGK